jgi:virulence factor Mce-like protein
MVRHQKLIAFVATMIVVVGGLVAMMRGNESPRMTVTASFDKAIGLYPGSSVRILGVRVGTIRSVTPDGPKVRVVMDLPTDTPVPADVTAVVIPPSLVSDRYVELTPVYEGGDRLADGTDISKTLTPVELDEILGSMDSLLVALGPKGANADGSLAELVDVGAKTLANGGGKDLNDTIVNLATAVKTLSDNSDDTTAVITNLAAFTHTLAENDAKIRHLTANLATATSYLAGESESLAQALKNLSIALGEVASLVHEHRDELGSDIRTLAQVTQVVVKHKASLIEALDVLPLGATNIAGTINTERHTLDIRNNNHQADDPYSVVVCQILSPITGIPCPPAPAAPAKAAVVPSPAAAAAAAKAKAAEELTDRLSLRGVFGGAR